MRIPISREKDEHMVEARLVQVGGIARLAIDGRQVEPIIYPSGSLPTADPGQQSGGSPDQACRGTWGWRFSAWT